MFSDVPTVRDSTIAKKLHSLGCLGTEFAMLLIAEHTAGFFFWVSDAVQ